MATASPTPRGQGSQFSSLGRRTSARQALRRPPSRPQLGRAESNPIPSAVSATGRETRAAQSQQFATMNDSSDDEIPVPMKLSALTKALLNDGTSAPEEAPAGAPAGAPAPAMMTRRRSVLSKSTSSVATAEKESENHNLRQTRRHVRVGSAQAAPASSSRPVSPARSRETSPVPRKRVVRLSTTPAGGGLQSQIRRSLSASKHARRPPSRERTDEKEQPSEPPAAVKTPATGMRRVQIAVGSSGSKAHVSGSSAVSSKLSASAHQSDYETAADEPATDSRPQGSASRFGTGSRGREVEPALPSSMRVKRVGKIPGSFLSGPARRGRRRQSDEEEGNSPIDEHGDGDLVVSRPEQESQAEDGIPAPVSSFYAPYMGDLAASGSPVSAKDLARASLRRQASRPESQQPSQEAEAERALQPSRPLLSRANLPSAHDQENEIPYALKGFVKPTLAEKEVDVKAYSALDPDAVARPPPAVSPERKALAQISKNTPHRPAPPPPPPKMSVLETATAPAGAATTAQASKKQRVLLKVNGRSYQRIDCLGRGGSGKVYKVTAENGKWFALKRVSIENADEATIKGYLGEIDLLKTLSGVDRVIQLFDYEMNKEKQMLSLLMEMGELDLNTLLKARQNPENCRLDPVFIRFYWKEMLECLQAVHSHDIVHSDLKPANFVLVQGRLKLIDFGIANAIQTDQTVNVHRETQIGTPNYMSPESLMDSQQYAFSSASSGRLNLPHGPKGPKLMKLGKPSDVWSLGCILYQMVYGIPPFGHIQNQMARCHAIINWSHAIDFPDKGLGGAAVPASLLRTMRRCLNREQNLRPTCEDLLSESDPFLYPREYDLGLDNALPVTEDLLGRIIQSVVARCRERMPTDGEAISAWPAAYWASVRKAVAPKDTRS